MFPAGSDLLSPSVSNEKQTGLLSACPIKKPGKIERDLSGEADFRWKGPAHRRSG